MKKRMMAIALVTMMVVFFLADVRLDIRPAEDMDAGPEQDRQNNSAVLPQPGSVREFMGLLLRTWVRSVQEGFRVK